MRAGARSGMGAGVLSRGHLMVDRYSLKNANENISYLKRKKELEKKHS
jgi:hypothetical protein